MGPDPSWEISIRRVGSDLLVSSLAIWRWWWMKHEVKMIRRWVHSKRHRAAKALGRQQARKRVSWQGENDWLKLTSRTVNKEMSLLCVGTGPLVLQTHPPTEVLVPGESWPWWWTGVAASLSCFSGFGAGCRLLGDCSLCREGAGTPLLWAPCWDLCPAAAAACWGARIHPGRAARVVWRIWIPEAGMRFVCWGAAEQQAQDRGNAGSWGGEKCWKSEAEVLFHGLGGHGDALSHWFTETLCFSKPNSQDRLWIWIVLLKDAASCFWYKG